MNKWECTECGHVAEGHKPPTRCPDCDAPATAFESYEEDAAVEEWDDDEDDWDDDWEDDDGDDDWEDDDGDDDWDL